jgi:serine/threonine protein kinase
MQLATGIVVGERYVVEALLGQGGMAVVYRVRHRTLGTVHALKLVGVTSASARERLLREGRLQGQLQHPNVVGVTDQLEVQGVPALVLELVDGPSLAQLVGTALSVAQVDALGAGILAGVAAAHANGLVHRDLKPGNVLVAVEGGRAVPKVTDFGLAVEPDSGDRSTRTGATLGTPEYMAPEQVRSAKGVDARADVWALGVLLYELATGVLPFQDEDRLTLFQKIAGGAHVPVRERRPELPERMVATIEAALRVDREQRPADAGALLVAWSAEVHEARIDDLARRVQALAPSAASSSGGDTPPPAPELAGATWAPPPTMVRPPDPPPSSDPLPPPPPLAVVEPRGAPIAVVVAGALVLLGVGVLFAALALVIPVVMVLRDAQTRVVVVPEAPRAAPAPSPGGEIEPPQTREFAQPVKAREALVDGRFFAVIDEGHFFLAVSDEAELMVATGARATGEAYQAREEVTKLASGSPPGSVGEALAATLAGRWGPLDTYVSEHPEDLSAHLWRIWTLCPGSRCGAAHDDVDAIARAAEGRGLPHYAAAVVALAEGRLDEAESELDAWEAVVGPAEPSLVVERARLRLAQGRPAEVGPLLDPLDRRSSYAGWAPVLRAVAAVQRGDEVTWQDLSLKALSAPVGHAWLFARSTAPALAAAGRVDESERLLAEAIRKQFLGDDIAALLWADLQLQRAASASRRGRTDTVDAAVIAVKSVTQKDHQHGWTRERSRRMELVAEGIRLAAHGNREGAARRLSELEAADSSPEDLETLRSVLSP